LVRKCRRAEGCECEHDAAQCHRKQTHVLMPPLRDRSRTIRRWPRPDQTSLRLPHSLGCLTTSEEGRRRDLASVAIIQSDVSHPRQIQRSP
jgi:hypothetical protein